MNRKNKKILTGIACTLPIVVIFLGVTLSSKVESNVKVKPTWSTAPADSLYETDQSFDIIAKSDLRTEPKGKAPNAEEQPTMEKFGGNVIQDRDDPFEIPDRMYTNREPTNPEEKKKVLWPTQMPKEFKEVRNPNLPKNDPHEMWTTGNRPATFIPTPYYPVSPQKRIFSNNGDGTLSTVLKQIDASNQDAMKGKTSKLSDFILAIAQESGLDPTIIVGVMERENSQFDPTLTHLNRNGSIDYGLMQINNRTAPWLADRMNIRDYREEMLFDPEFNIRMGVEELKYLSQKYPGDYHRIFTSYNRGEGGANKWMREHNTYETDYSREVVQHMAELSSTSTISQ